MLNQQTRDVLTQLKLPGFIEVLDEIQNNSTMHHIELSEAITLMADRETLNRKRRKQQRLLRSAKLRYPQASIESVDYQAKRAFNQSQFRELLDGQWVDQARNIILIGPTGVGKSYLACALGYQMCRQLFSVRYYRVSRLVEALKLSHADGSYSKLLEQLAKKHVLILDDWGIDQLDRQARRDLLEVLEDRSARMATVITTQLPVQHWHHYIGDDTIADAICDRVINAAYQLNIEGNSMRKMNKNLTHVDHSVS